MKTVLYDLQKDPHEMCPIEDETVIGRLRRQMTKLMLENDAPVEQYERMGLQKEFQELKNSR